MPIMLHRGTCPTIPLRQLYKVLGRVLIPQNFDEPTAKELLALLVDIYQHWPPDMEFPSVLAALWFEARKAVGTTEKR